MAQGRKRDPLCTLSDVQLPCAFQLNEMAEESDRVACMACGRPSDGEV